MRGKARKITRVLLLLLVVINSKAQPFIHPGLLNSKEDLERMKYGVVQKIEPLYSGYLIFAAHAQSRFSYNMQGPLASVSRNPTVGQAAYDSDANAAYQNAIMWCISGNKAYAEKSMEIVNAWSGTLKSITGKDAVLMAGLGPFKMVNAAEILRYTNTGWSAADIKQTEKHFKEVIYPVLKDFAPFANGNWDSAALKTVMAIAIFCNDRQMYEQALRYYVDGPGNGALTHYIINEDGQCQESGRDQAHTQLGIAHLGDCCEMAWHQGLNLYAYANNRLLKGFEYTAKFNLGYDVSYIPAMDRTGKYEHAAISNGSRGQLRPIYEQIYNHYANRTGLPVPYTQQAAEKIRPEQQGQPGADHPGFGTLFYSIPNNQESGSLIKSAPATPGGIIIQGSLNEIKLSWIAPVSAKSYIIKRASKAAGGYSIIAKGIIGPNYIDKNIKSGRIYYYRISALNDQGGSENSSPATTVAGLPFKWKSSDVGNLDAAGSANYDGSMFTIKTSGSGIGGTQDGFQYVYLHLRGNGTIVARFVPQVPSQFAEMGLMIRDSLTSGAANVSLLIGPHATKDIELPVWSINFSTRSVSGESAIVNSYQNLAEPYSRWGRLMEPYWLKLSRNGNRFSAYMSPDGKKWNIVGTKEIYMKRDIHIGLAAASCIQKMPTTVHFDNVVLTNSK